MTDEAAIDERFDAAIARAIASLSPAFADRLGSVAIVIDDEPTPEQLASVGAHGLFGLYQGVPRTTFGAESVPIPSKITIFRGPIVRANGAGMALDAAVEETVLHEIAHHFGLSDARLLELRRG
ncbi:MAG: metallopeptidase family protein [Chloroflexota bacterium]